MTLLLFFLFATVLVGMASSRFGAWAYVLVTMSAVFTTLVFYGVGRFWA
jgi:hypothetical protein